MVDDPSRWTPVREALPIVLQRLHAAGIGQEDITISVGVGRHHAVDPKRYAATAWEFDRGAAIVAIAHRLMISRPTLTWAQRRKEYRCGSFGPSPKLICVF